MFVCFLRKFKHWLPVCFLRKKPTSGPSLLLHQSENPTPSLDESSYSISDSDATKTTLLQNRFRFHLRSERVGVHLRRNHGWKFTFVWCPRLEEKREERVIWVFGDGRKHGGALLPSGPDTKKRRVSYFYEPSRASTTTTTTKVTHWNPTGSAWPITCSDSVNPPPAGLSVPSSSSTVATPISLSTGSVGSTMRRSLRLLGFATSMISCLAFLTKQSNKIQFQHFHKLIIDQCCKFIFK